MGVVTMESGAPQICQAEYERLKALGRFDILDTPPEEAFDRITRLLPQLFNVPMAGISFVAESRLWIKSRVGLDLTEIPREVGFCAYVIQNKIIHNKDDVLVISDTLSDRHYPAHPIATREWGVRFYAGAPLVTRDGHAVGTLWMVDRKPRSSFTAGERQILDHLAKVVMDELELRVSRRRLAEALKARRQVERRLRLINRISEESAAASDFHTAIGTVLKLLASHFGVDYAQAWSLAPDASHLVIEGEYAASDQTIEPFRAIFGGQAPTPHNSMIGQSALHQRVLTVADLAELDPVRYPWAAVVRRFGLVSLVCLPFQDTHNRFVLNFLFKSPPADLPSLPDMISQLSGEIQAVLAHKRRDDALRQAQRLEAVGQLTGGIAHGFNNMLTVIAGNVDRVIGMLPEGTSPRRLLSAALSAAEQAEKLTQQLLAYSRRQPLRPRPADINPVIARVETLLAGALGERVVVHKSLALDLAPALVDPDQFEAALLNLLLNARDAMPAGGTITVTTAGVTLDAEEAAQLELAPGGYTELRVIDTGNGMSPEVMARAFEPFFTTKGVGEGIGLGLSQVYGFVKQSKGYVELKSKLGAGTTVRIFLPCGPVAAPSPRAPERATVLVVEDDDQVREFAVCTLREFGYTVLEAVDGAAARELFDRHRTIDVLFTDLVMPGEVSGLDLVDALRAERPDLPIIVTSGYATAMRDNKFPTGVRFLRKPYRAKELAQTLAEMLDPRAPDIRTARPGMIRS